MSPSTSSAGWMCLCCLLIRCLLQLCDHKRSNSCSDDHFLQILVQDYNQHQCVLDFSGLISTGTSDSLVSLFTVLLHKSWWPCRWGQIFFFCYIIRDEKWSLWSLAPQFFGWTIFADTLPAGKLVTSLAVASFLTVQVTFLSRKRVSGECDRVPRESVQMRRAQMWVGILFLLWGKQVSNAFCSCRRCLPLGPGRVFSELIMDLLHGLLEISVFQGFMAFSPWRAFVPCHCHTAHNWLRPVFCTLSGWLVL